MTENSIYIEDDSYDVELDLCLNILADQQYESSLYLLLNMESNRWINVKDKILPNETLLSHKIEAMWCKSPSVDDMSEIIVFFINKETLEIVHGIYYNYKNLT